MKRSIMVALMLVVLCCTLVGCTTLTMDNYEKIEVGMTLDEVVEILGDYDVDASVSISIVDTGVYVWQNDTVAISVSFVAGVAVSKTQTGL